MGNVYKSVLASGGGVTPTPITPSNSSPASMTAGTVYEPTANGVAIESYTNLTPAITPATLTDGDIYKMNGGGYAVSTYDEIVPDNLNPPVLNIGGNFKTKTYSGHAINTIARTSPVTPSSSGAAFETGWNRMTAGGYAIESRPTTITSQQLQSGVYFSSGIKNMEASGYAYASQPTLTETTLWTNSAPTANFAAQDVTLSQSLANFDYVKVQYAKTKSKTSDVQMSVIIPYSDFLHTISSEDSGRLRGALYYYSTYRQFYYVSATSIHFTGAASGTTAYNDYCIPTKISGLKI